MNNHIEIADILDGAADHIEKYGHIRGTGHGNLDDPKRGPACVVGAINVARDWGRLSPWIDPLHIITAVQGVVGTNVVIWNDAPERTKQEVLDALRLAAKQERIQADNLGGDAA